MKTEEDIKAGLKELEILKTKYISKIANYDDNISGIVYDTDLIRKLEALDAQILTLKWVLK